MKKLIMACFALGLISAGNSEAALTLNFSELSNQPVEGLSYRGITTFLEDPSFEGDAEGVLTLEFALGPTDELQFDIALSTDSTLTSGFTVGLFDAGLASLRVARVETSPPIIWAEGQFSYSRTPISQAIINDPEILILDEPTIGLDPKQILEVRKLIQELGHEHTVILSTHILPEVSQTCGRILIINKGKIVAEGTPDELTAHLQGAGRVLVEVGNPAAETPAVLGNVEDVLEVRPQGDGRYEVLCAPNVDRRSELACAVVAQGWALLELRAVDMSLEDIFLELTTDEAPAEVEEEAPDA